MKPMFKIIQGVQEKMCFLQFTANPPSPTSLKETFKALSAMRVYSHSYWLVFFCTTNSSRMLASEMWQTIENSWEKTQYFKNTLYLQEVLQTSTRRKLTTRHLPRPRGWLGGISRSGPTSTPCGKIRPSKMEPCTSTGCLKKEPPLPYNPF